MRRSVLIWPARVLAALLAVVLLAALALAVFGWNWARGPLEDLALRQTGRVLHLDGDLEVRLAWPLPRVHASGVRFANPAWATAPQMLNAEAVEASVDLLALLRGRLALPELRLVQARIFLEQGLGADGLPRKTWLMDRAQADESSRLQIGRVLLDRTELRYTDGPQRTDVLALLSTSDGPAASARPLSFTLEGRFRGQALTARGSGGAVLAWRDDQTAMPLQVEAKLGATQLRAEGMVTGLMPLKALDMQLALRGASLAALDVLTGVALPPTPPYRTQGHLVRAGPLWRYESFTGEVGHSDIAGTLQLDTSTTRPMLRGAVTSRRLDLADLGPAIGAHDPAAPGTRVLPDLPFDTARWDSLDADVAFAAQTLLRPKTLPLDKLQVHLVLQDRQMTLDRLAFGLAGGQLRAQVLLDGRAAPMRGRASLQLRGVQLGRLLPTVDLSRATLGQLSGDAELSGQGASVGQLLATADGRLRLQAQDGRISRLLMEQIGLHLLEILRLNLTGDETVPLRCALADFAITDGLMQVHTMLLDTSVSTVVGSGSVNLATETLDLSFTPRTKVSSVIALRSPIYLRGSFGQPAVALDRGRIAARGLGALALGLVNPLLALLPLVDPGPGVDNACAEALRAVAAPAAPAAPAQPARKP